MYNNEYKTLFEALEVAKTRLDKGQLLDDGADNWDADSLIEASRQNTYDDDEAADGYYVVGHDGSV